MGTSEQENEALCKPYCDSSTLQQNVKQFYDNIPSCLHETIDDIYYWDQSIAVLAMGQDDFCEEWVTRKVTVSLVDGPFFGTVLDDSMYGAEIKACNKANRTKFLDTYWAAFRGLAAEIDACASQSSSRQNEVFGFLRSG